MAIRTKEMLFTSRDAAEFLKLDPNTIATYVKRKLLVPVSRVGTSYLFTKPEVERFKKLKRSRGNPNFVKTAADVPASRRRKVKATAKA